MSRRTDRLVALFPDAYAARERESLLYKLLDALGRESVAADEAVTELLKSHWVDYAEGPALDGLGAIFGVGRRRLPSGQLELDGEFRLRLKFVVPFFTGGGTRRAVLGAVRSALGLPFDLDQLNVPESLRRDLEELVKLVEFVPIGERLVDEITGPAQAGQLTLDVPVRSVRAERPRITWTFTESSGSQLRVERLDSGTGVQAVDPGNPLRVDQGGTLRLSAAADGRLTAFLDEVDVTDHFRALDGGDPVLPEVPRHPSKWRFSAAQNAGFDESTFDFDTFDRPLFRVEMTWIRQQPLTFNVVVPYLLKQAVNDLKARHNFSGEIFVFEELNYDSIQQVVDQTRAAGVRGSVHFSLNFRTDHDAREAPLGVLARHRIGEDAAAAEQLRVQSHGNLAESHEMAAQLGLGAPFDVARFDSGFVFT